MPGVVACVGKGYPVVSGRKAADVKTVSLCAACSIATACFLAFSRAHTNATTPGRLCDIRTDARSYVGTTLLVALGTPVTRHSSDTILARTLPRRLIAGLPRGADWVAVTCWKANTGLC